MTTGRRPILDEYWLVDAPVACPYCGNALREGVWHSCRELRADAVRVRVPFRWPVWLGPLIQLAVVVFILAYIGAHALVAAGVACP